MPCVEVKSVHMTNLGSGLKWLLYLLCFYYLFVWFTWHGKFSLKLSGSSILFENLTNNKTLCMKTYFCTYFNYTLATVGSMQRMGILLPLSDNILYIQWRNILTEFIWDMLHNLFFPPQSDMYFVMLLANYFGGEKYFKRMPWRKILKVLCFWVSNDFTAESL
jgi:hypothetical protein